MARIPTRRRRRTGARRRRTRTTEETPSCRCVPRARRASPLLPLPWPVPALLKRPHRPSGRFRPPLRRTRPGASRRRSGRACARPSRPSWGRARAGASRPPTTPGTGRCPPSTRSSPRCSVLPASARPSRWGWRSLWTGLPCPASATCRTGCTCLRLQPCRRRAERRPQTRGSSPRQGLPLDWIPSSRPPSCWKPPPPLPPPPPRTLRRPPPPGRPAPAAPRPSFRPGHVPASGRRARSSLPAPPWRTSPWRRTCSTPSRRPLGRASRPPSRTAAPRSAAPTGR
mmetsp:Transcript_23436/g.89009  ORF Transcript_23436/g.89009 Transcript_23436/m.89009 type:complete len:284 (+) Transcript_23436:989-1840(+)